MNHIYFNPSVGETVSPAATVNVAPAAENPSPTPAVQTFAFTVFKSEKDNTPQSGNRTWGDFAKRIQNHAPRKSKEGTELFSPVTYREGAKRGNNGVLTITMAVFDVDGGATPDAVKSILEGFAYAIHSTWSHTPEKPSYRVIVPFTTPVQKDDWPQIWARLNLFLGGINDPATKDPARIYYVPSHPEGRNDYFVEVGEGKFLDPNELPDLPTTIRAQVQSADNRYTGNVEIEGIEDIPREFSPEAGLHEACRRCAFMQQVSQPDNQNNVSEPHWKAMISNAACFENSDEWIHQASCHHDGYSEQETNKSIQRSRDSSYGPMTCQRIQDLGFKGCPAGGCKTPTGKVTRAPAGLGSWITQKSDKYERSTQKVASGGSKPEEVKAFLNREFPAGLYYVNETFYAYSAGAWSAQDERADIRRKIAEFFGGDAKAKKISDTLTLLKDFQSIREADLNQNKHLVCLQNGTLDTQRNELVAHSPSHGLTSKTNIVWNPEAACPRWLRFLDEIFVNDIDKAQKIAFVQDWFGYCLVPDSSQHKFVWMVGAGGNGKSVLLSVLTQLVGAANVSHAYIERLDEKYVRAELEGKLVNISSEMSAEATISDGYLKAIVAGDIVEAEKKFKPSFSFRPFVRLIGATNNLPRLLDHSDGFARRAVILTFGRKFAEHEQDTTLEHTLLNELPGILKWAVDGLCQLRTRGRFEIPQSSVQALLQYRRESDPVQIFAEECLELVDGGGMAPADVYEFYKAWNRQNGFSQMNKVRFGKRLAEILGNDRKRRSGGKDYWLVRISSDNDYFTSHEVPIAHEWENTASFTDTTKVGRVISF